MYKNAWHWVYGIKNIVMESIGIVVLVFQKIRLLDVLTKFVEKISNMFKKDYVYLGLNKKSAKKLQAGFDEYIKAVNFTIYFCCSSYHKLLNLINRVKWTKLDKHIIYNGKANIGIFSIETDLQDLTIRNVARYSFGKLLLLSKWRNYPGFI